MTVYNWIAMGASVTLILAMIGRVVYLHGWIKGFDRAKKVYGIDK